MKNPKKLLLPVIVILIMLFLTGGLTYALLSLGKIGGTNTITTGTVSMSFTESTNIISLTNALPMDDTHGKTQTNYFDFSVTSNVTLESGDPENNVPYEISIIPVALDPGYTTLTTSQIKVYLAKVANSVETSVVSPVLMANLSKSVYTTTNQSLYGTMHIHSYGTNTITSNYRLRVWLDYSVDASSWINTTKYQYKFKLKINSGIQNVGYTTPENCFVYTTSGNTATITNYSCYPSNGGYLTYNEDNKSNIRFMASDLDSGNSAPSYPNVVIPATLGGKTVTEIYSNAFEHNFLTSVVIPEGVTTIGSSAFFNNDLSSIIIPNSVTTIGTDAFASNKLSVVYIKSGSSLISTSGIESHAFQATNDLTIYNNSGKTFKWYSATQNRNNLPDPAYNFITGVVPAYNGYHQVLVTTGTP